MTKYDELIGKLSLLVKRLEKKKNETFIKYNDILAEEEKLKKDIETSDIEYKKIKKILKVLANYNADLINWCKKHWWYILGIFIIWSFVFYAHVDISSLVDFLFIYPNWIYSGSLAVLAGILNFANCEYEKKYIISKYSDNKDKLLERKHVIEETIDKKRERLEEIDEEKTVLLNDCKISENDFIRYNTLMFELIGSRNLAYALADGNLVQIDSIFESDTRSKETMRLMREKVENNETK